MPEPTPDITQRVIQAALDAGLPPEIALQRFWAESRFIHSKDGLIVKSLGNCGIAQLNETFNPGACSMTEDESIREGVRQLAEYWREFGDERRVVTAYVQGISAARRVR